MSAEDHPREDGENVNGNDKYLFLRLQGRNQVTYAQILQNLTDILVGFPGLKEDLKVKTFDFSSQRVFPAFPAASPLLLNKRENKISLSDLARYANADDTRSKLPNPVEVFVFAKRKVSITIKFNSVVFIATLIIGDESGLCKMVMFNDAIDSIYNLVEVGDQLMIDTGSYSHYLITEHHHGFIYPSSKTLFLEIKTNVFDARKIYVIKDNVGLKFKAMMSKVTEGSSMSKLWTVNDLTSDNACELYPAAEKLGEGEAAEIDQKEKHIRNVSIIGIIKYAGRLEQSAKLKNTSEVSCCRNPELYIPANATCTPNDDFRIQYQQYTGSRWMELIDITNPAGKSSLVRIHINNIHSWNLQKSLIPGNIVVLTHMLFRTGYLQSSAYSEIYLFPTDIPNYLRRMPTSYLETGKHYWNVESWKSCLNKIELSLGGFYFRNILNNRIIQKEKKNYEDNIRANIGFPTEPFIDGEVQRIVLQGKIVSRYDAQTEIPFTPTMTQDTNSERVVKVCGPLISNEIFKKLSFRRKLPTLITDDSRNNAGLLAHIEKQYQGYFTNFCMEPYSRQIEILSSLENDLEVDLKPYCILEIEDCRNPWLYHAYWAGDTEEEMKLLLDEVEGKRLLCFIDVQKIRYPFSPVGYVFETIVSDFAPIPDNQASSESDRQDSLELTFADSDAMDVS